LIFTGLLSNCSKVIYRKDIQILRGISILFVLAYHFGIPVIKSGFLGVDIFFVISGFLMAKIYDPNDKGHFLERRALRLLPAYFSVIFFTVLVSIFVVTPNEFNQVSAQSLFSIFFSSNLGFWAQNSYFSSNEFNPLLHLWSLGVEIQFYLIMPVLFYLFKINKIIYIFILVGSFLLCLFVIGISPKTSFFMMPLRLWEFLVGFGVARYVMPNQECGSKNNFLFSTIGMVLILSIPFVNVDGFSFDFVNGHPGLAAVVVTLSTGLVLLYGIGFFNRFYTVGCVLEKIGQYSYSIYLVHFPVIVLFLYQPFSGTSLKIDGYDSYLYVVILTALLSYLSYHFIEIKLTKSRNIRSILIIAPFSIVLLILIGVYVQDNIFSDRQFKISSAFSDREEYRCEKLFKLLNPLEKMCIVGGEGASIDKKVLLMGDSHAESIKVPFANIAKKNNIQTYFFVRKKFLVDEYKLNYKIQRTEQISASDTIIELLNKNIKHIVIHYKKGNVDVGAIAALVEGASKHDVRVSYIMPTPAYSRHVPKTLWNDDVPIILKSRLEYIKGLEKHLNELEEIEASNFKVYGVVDYFCENKCEIASDDGMPYYFDSDHLTITGAKLLNPLFDEIYQQ